jgi:hypothetical protein
MADKEHPCFDYEDYSRNSGKQVDGYYQAIDRLDEFSGI